MLQYKHRLHGKNLPYLRLPHRTQFLEFASYIYRDTACSQKLKKFSPKNSTKSAPKLNVPGVLPTFAPLKNAPQKSLVYHKKNNVSGGPREMFCTMWSEIYHKRHNLSLH